MSKQQERKTPAWRESTPSILECPTCAQVSVVKVVGGDASHHCFGCGCRWPTEEAYLADFAARPNGGPPEEGAPERPVYDEKE